MILHPESHTDHHLRPTQVDHILSRFQKQEGFFVETFEFPEELGTVLCGLHGPIMGNLPIGDEEVSMEVRGNRAGPSRICNRYPQPTRLVTVIGGPHEEACPTCKGTGRVPEQRASQGWCQYCRGGRLARDILYTAYGGPCAPREPWDPSLDEVGKAESVAFWATHALSR